MSVNTVLGQVGAQTLGKVLIHEHFLFGFSGYHADSTVGYFRRDEAMRKSVAAAEAAKSYGVSTVVDATPNECGRDPVFLKEVSEQTGIHIICCTGCYYEAATSASYWNARAQKGDAVAEISDMMRTEILCGIGGTGVRAGAIKVASGKGAISEFERRFFLAAAQVQKETGVPIITHTEHGTMGPEQCRLLIDHGAEPGKIVIGHMCGSVDLQYHEAVLACGVYDSFDRFGLEGAYGCYDDKSRIETLCRLLERGYGSQLLISHDSVAAFLGRPLAYDYQSDPATRKANIGTIGNYILPELLRRGVTLEQLNQVMVKNPQRLFS